MSKQRNHIQILSGLIEGLNDSIGACGALVHHFQSPKWMAVRDMLNIIRDKYIAGTVTEHKPK